MITFKMSGIDARISITLISTKKEFNVRNNPIVNAGNTFVNYS